MTGSIQAPDAAIFPSRSNGWPNSCCVTASITMFPGPVSNAITSLKEARSRNRREVRNAANVLNNPPHARVAK